MKNRKIAIVCNSINPDLVEYFKCKIRALNKSKYKNSFIVLKNKKIDIKDPNVYISSYSTSAFFDKKIPLDFLTSFRVFLQIMFNKVKIVHFTTAHISNLFLSILLKPFNVKQIFTIHDLIPHPNEKAIFISLYNKFIINFLADEIISFSQREIEKQIKKDKFKYFTLSGFKQYISEPKIGERTILFFGRIEPYKGLNNLLDIIKEANDLNLNYKFIIAGKGNIENIDEFKKYNNVKIINRYINDDEIFYLFQKATFTILPYNSATQSGVTILSYSYATPVIAYDVGSLREYIDDKYNGYVVPYGDNKKILNILKNITDEEIEKLSKHAIEIFNSRYSKTICEKTYINYYAKLLFS